MSTPSDMDLFKAEQAKLLALVAEQNEREFQQRKLESERDHELRRLELAKQDELTRSNLERADADRILAAERAKANQLATEHNAYLSNLIESVKLLVMFLQNGQFNHKILGIQTSLNSVVKIVEALIFVILGKGNISIDDLLELVKTALIDVNPPERSNSQTFQTVKTRNNSALHKTHFSREAFVAKLSECQIIQANLDEVVNELKPSDIRNNVKISGALKGRIIQLADSVANYNAWDELVRVLKWLEGDSIAVLDLVSYLEQTGKI